MAVYQDVDVQHLKPSSVQIGEGFIVGTLAQDSKLNYLRQNAMCGFFDNTYAAIKLAEQLVQIPKGESCLWDKRHADDSEEKSDDRSWTTFETFPESVQALLYDPRHLYTYTKKDTINTEATSSGNQITYDTSGDYLDIDRYLMNDPECFANAADGKSQGRFVDLYIQPTVGWMVNKDDVLKISQEVSRMTEWLEFNQIRCRIIGIYSCECGHIEVKLKDYSDKLNENELKVFCFPDFFRRIVFAFYEFSPTWEHGYGSPQSFFKEEIVQDSWAAQGLISYKSFFGFTGGLNYDYKEVFIKQCRELLKELELKESQ